MADLFSTDVVNGVVDDTKRPSSFFLDTYFPTVTRDDSEEIHFDIIDSSRRLAPFVSAHVPGRVVAEKGKRTATFTPAYVKILTPLNPVNSIQRAQGEKIGGGEYTPMQRQMMRLASTIDDHVDQVTRRKESMAVEVMRLGQVTVSGDEYETKVVSYGRDASLTVTLTGANLWSDAASTPLADLDAWALKVLKLSGTRPRKVTMDTDAYAAFIRNQSVLDELDNRNITGNIIYADAIKDDEVGGVLMARTRNYDIYVYADWYRDETSGLDLPFLPSGTVLMGGAGIQGVQAHGAILDEGAGLQAREIFSKSWVPENPSIRQVLTQCAPLIVPKRVNASHAATVL